MDMAAHPQRAKWPVLAWTIVVLSGFLAPALAISFLSGDEIAYSATQAITPFVAIGVMGAGMIGAAVAARLGIGILLSILAGAALISLAYTVSPNGIAITTPIAMGILIASFSFAARGALFAKSALDKGWWIAVFVVAGEAAILATAFARPGAIPGWILVLLPAQWTNMALEAALAGQRFEMAIPPLIALGGTAMATLLVAKLWPRRWPYLIMFTTWLALSGFVWLMRT